MPELNDATLIRIGERLPDLRLPRADGAERPLRGPHRDAVVVVAMHDADCDRCRSYLRELAEAGSRFRIWDGTVRAVTDDPGVADRQSDVQAGKASEVAGGVGGGSDVGVDVLIDAERNFLDRVAADEGPVVLVADRYGQLFEIFSAGAEHALPGPRELEEWLQYLATQCPE